MRATVELLDGGTGEELFRRGMLHDRKIWSAGALVHEQYHSLLVDVHASFLHAGSDFITCNNYGVTPGVGFSEEDIAKLSALAGQLARRAVDAAGVPGKRVCGSLPPLVESYRPDRVPEFNQGVHLYLLIGSAMHEHVDFFLAETLSSIDEAKMAVTGVQDFRKPVMVSFTLNSHGHLRSGQSVGDAIQELLHYQRFHTRQVKVHAVLFNCSLPESVTFALEQIQGDDEIQTAITDNNLRLGAYANRLTAIADDWMLAGSSEPQAMRTDVGVITYLEFVHTWIDLGVTLVGGCCGIGPEYIEAMNKLRQERGGLCV